VTQVNADVAGIQLPELLAPLATYAGWNYRSSYARKLVTA
jgi:hypothetical protein